MYSEIGTMSLRWFREMYEILSTDNNSEFRRLVNSEGTLYVCGIPNENINTLSIIQSMPIVVNEEICHITIGYNQSWIYENNISYIIMRQVFSDYPRIVLSRTLYITNQSFFDSLFECDFIRVTERESEFILELV